MMGRRREKREPLVAHPSSRKCDNRLSVPLIGELVLLSVHGNIRT